MMIFIPRYLKKSKMKKFIGANKLGKSWTPHLWYHFLKTVTSCTCDTWNRKTVIKMVIIYFKAISDIWWIFWWNTLTIYRATIARK
jgi:hypothetical protein